MDLQNNILKNNKFWIILTVLITTIHVIYASIIQRGAYLDGAMLSVVLLDKFSHGQYFIYSDPEHTRFFMNFLNELPMAFGYFILMIKSKYWLSVLFSLPLFLFPPLIIWWNYKLSQRTKRQDIFVLSVFIYATILLPFSIFSIVEIINAALLQFVLLNYLAGKIDYTKKDIALITILVLFLFGSQEYVVFLGFVLFAGALYYASKEENVFNKKIKYGIGLGGLLSSLYVIVFLFLHQQTQGESIRFMKEAIDFIPNLLNLNSILSILTILIVPFILLKKDCFSKKIIIIISLIYIYLLWHMFNHLNIYLIPMWEGHFRTIPCWAMPMLFTIIPLLDAIKKRPSNIFYSNLLTVGLMCTIAQTIWQINNSYWFNKNIEYMQKELKACPNALYIPEEHEEMSSFINKDLRRYIWNFSYTSTSILFAPQKEIKTILMQPSKDRVGNFSYREWLYVNDNEMFTIPTQNLHIRNKFWDATKVTDALDDYNRAHHLRTREQTIK